MLSYVPLLLMAPPPSGDGQGGGGSILPTVIMFGAIILIMYFMMIRPQQKRQKEHQKMLDSITKGDKVVTTTGMHGKVTDSDDKTYLVEIAENVRVRFEKAAIAAKVEK